MKRPPNDDGQQIVPLKLRAIAKPNASTWRAFNRFVRDVDELVEYDDGLQKLFYQNDDGRTASDVESEAEFCRELVARCQAGLERFDHAENYGKDEDGELVLRHSYIAKRVGILVASFPNANPSDVDGYVTMLVEHVAATDLTELSLESACREIVETQKFAPAIAEVMSVINRHIDAWWNRQRAIGRAEGMRLSAIKALIEHEQERKEQEHGRQLRMATNQVVLAIKTTKQLAEQIETKKGELAALVQRHAEAEKRESELMRALRKLTTPPEEAEAAAVAKTNGAGTKHLPL